MNKEEVIRTKDWNGRCARNSFSASNSLGERPEIEVLQKEAQVKQGGLPYIMVSRCLHNSICSLEWHRTNMDKWLANFQTYVRKGSASTDCFNWEPNLRTAPACMIQTQHVVSTQFENRPKNLWLKTFNCGCAKLKQATCPKQCSWMQCSLGAWKPVIARFRACTR